eukprot:scaffold10941_cov81-Phaeocystis_antarctica.AAC.2
MFIIRKTTPELLKPATVLGGMARCAAEPAAFTHVAGSVFLWSMVDGAASAAFERCKCGLCGFFRGGGFQANPPHPPAGLTAGLFW